MTSGRLPDDTEKDVGDSNYMKAQSPQSGEEAPKVGIFKDQNDLEEPSTFFSRKEEEDQPKVELNLVPINANVILKKEIRIPSVSGMKSRRELMINVRVESLDDSKQAATKALIDSGCQDCCIDRKFVKRMNIQTKKLDHYITPRNADGTVNAGGMIELYVELRTKIGSHTEILRYLVTDLKISSIFIGFNWLKMHNPEIDWIEPSIQFTRCPKECNMDLVIGKPRNWQEAVDDENILLIDFEPALNARGIYICAKYTTAQELAEEANQNRERLTEERFQYNIKNM